MVPSEKTSAAGGSLLQGSEGAGLGGQVEQRLVLHQFLDVGRAAGGRLAVPHADLPVEDLDDWRVGVGPGDQHALRRQAAVDDAVALGVTQGVGELAQDLQPLAGGQAGAAGGEEVVQAHGLRVVLEGEDRAVLVDLEVVHPQDVRVIQPLKQPELRALRGPPDLVPARSSEAAHATRYWRARQVTPSSALTCLATRSLVAGAVHEQVAEESSRRPGRLALATWRMPASSIARVRARATLASMTVRQTGSMPPTLRPRTCSQDAVA